MDRRPLKKEGPFRFRAGRAPWRLLRTGLTRTTAQFAPHLQGAAPEWNWPARCQRTDSVRERYRIGNDPCGVEKTYLQGINAVGKLLAYTAKRISAPRQICVGIHGRHGRFPPSRKTRAIALSAIPFRIRASYPCRRRALPCGWRNSAPCSCSSAVCANLRTKSPLLLLLVPQWRPPGAQVATPSRHC
jgi:hypothetical protein